MRRGERRKKGAEGVSDIVISRWELYSSRATTLYSRKEEKATTHSTTRRPGAVRMWEVGRQQMG
jgi:hypothetical protein